MKEVFGHIKDYSWKTQKHVNIITLDSLIQKYGLPDLCKIDVEGYELEVIKGLSKKIPIISFEMHIEIFNEMVECIEQIEKLGSVKFNFANINKEKLLLPNWVSSRKLYESISLGAIHLVADIYARYL